MSDEAYKGLSEAEKIFKDLIWTPIIEGAKQALGSAVPFFKFPIISTITNAIINVVTEWLFNSLVMFIDVTAIRFTNSQNQAVYEDASIKLKVIAHDKGVDSNEFKEAREKAKIAMSKFTKFGAA